MIPALLLAQLNATVADFEGNTDRILDVLRSSGSSDLVVFPELAVSGYYPWDLMNRPDFMPRQAAALERIRTATIGRDTLVVLGCITENPGSGRPFRNTLRVLRDGDIVFEYHKRLLPTYGVFDERRHFEPGTGSGLLSTHFRGHPIRIGFFICEDAWNADRKAYSVDPLIDAVDADLLVGINASPSDLGKAQVRERLFAQVAKTHGCPLVYVNQVGAMDDIVFDGASFVLDGGGGVVARAASFSADQLSYQPDQVSRVEPIPAGPERAFRQITIGLQDYLGKTGLQRVLVGSSGGVDSALTLALAVAALGSDRVEAVTLPSRYSSPGSVDDSAALCKNLGIKLTTHPIGGLLTAAESGYRTAFGQPIKGAPHENLQARLRGVILMERANSTGAMLLTTGNKSETAVGYCTLYGDTNGGLNLIGDLYKTEVYDLCRWINRDREVIPIAILDKPPSAELSPDQKDSDTLPDYPTLDAILKLTIEHGALDPEEQAAAEQIRSRTPPETVARIHRLVDLNEFKRRQAPPIIRVRALAFGVGRRIPIVHR